MPRARKKKQCQVRIEPGARLRQPKICIPANEIPDVMEEVLSKLTPDQKERVKTHEAQTELVLIATEPDLADVEDAKALLVERMLSRLLTGNHLMKRNPRRSHETGLSESIQETLDKYEAFHQSAPEVAKRSFHRGNHVWTEVEKKRYAEAFVKYYGDQICNKKIAAYVGNGVSPQQCTEYKLQLKKSGALEPLIEEGKKSFEERILKWKRKMKLA